MLMYETLLVPILMYGSETVIWKDNLRGLLGIKRMDKISNAWIREMYKMTKGVDERIHEGILRCLGQT